MGDPVTIGMAVAGTVLGAYGQIQQGNAAEAAGKAQQKGLEYQAAQMEVQAGQERAAAQRRAMDERRKKTLTQSRAQAISAAGGGGSLDPTIVDIMGDLEAEGEYNANVAMYEGEERARDLLTGSQLRRYEGTQARTAGKMAKKSSRIAAAGSLLKGGNSLMDKYGGGNETIYWNDGSTTSLYR